MKFNFKKVAPICAGAILLGSTIGFAGALAADVSYPNDFANAIVVVGAGAAASDSTAANDIALDIGKLTTGTTASVSGGWLAQKSGSDLNYNDDIEDIDATIDSGDLPDLLADMTYKETKGTTDNEVDYEQYIDFTTGGDTLVFDTNDVDDNEPTDTFLKLA